MTTKISDQNFPRPENINIFPCVTSSRFLNAVEESVSVVRCCYDTLDTSLVHIDFSLVGAYSFVPYCKILKVDGEDISSSGILAPILTEHPLSSDIPLYTNCGILHGKLIVNFGEVIPNFNSAISVEFELGMVGSVPQAFGVSFPSQTAIANYIWNKGISLKPINLEYFNGNLNVLFQYDGNIECACNLQCVQPSGVTHSINFCPNSSQQITVFTGELNGRPQDLVISLRDSLGNLSNLTVQGLLGVIPSVPIVNVGTNPLHTVVAINYRSQFNDEIVEAEYQVLKFTNNMHNYTIWKDWSSNSWNNFIDTDITLGNTYGYAVRYRGKFLEVSNTSSWTIIQV